MILNNKTLLPRRETGVSLKDNNTPEDTIKYRNAVSKTAGKPYESYLLQVEKPGRYVGSEQNVVIKDVSKCELRLCISFPDMYEIGMSWMGLQVLYHLLNDIEGVYCERVFAPAPDFERIMRLNALPLVTLETKTPLSSLDIIGFTLQYELSFTNIINMLNLAGIPIKSNDRAEGDYPLLIAGGPCAHNPEPLAEVFDLFLIGDGEEAAKDLCELYLAHKRLRNDRFGDEGITDLDSGAIDLTDKIDRADGVEETDGIERTEEIGRTDELDQTDRIDQSDGIGQADKIDQSGGISRADELGRADRIDQPDRIYRTDRIDRIGRIDREAYLKAALRIRGVYVPAFYEPVYNFSEGLTGLKKLYKAAPDVIKKSIVNDLDNAFIPDKPVIPLIEIVQSRAGVEIFRGCTRGCRFCQAGMIYRPVRERTQSLIYQKAMMQLQNTGYDELSLMSLSTGDYSGIEVLARRLARDCKAKNVALSIPSLRMNKVSLKMLEEIQGYKKTGLTFAPEAGSQRMRDVINKNITEMDILTSVSQASALGWRHIKFYFMIGLPGETQEDIIAIADIVRKSLYEARKAQPGGSRSFTLTVSVSNFVPKPHTPFQWVEQESQEALYEKISMLKDIFSGMKGVKFQYHDTKASHVEALIARGDRRFLAVIEKAWELGCRFDSWQEHFDYSKWKEAFSFSRISMDSNGFDFEQTLPWDHIDSGVSKEFLRGEREKSLMAQKTPDCRDGCQGCGLDSF